ncbi:helix-turn-helix transcriptional regulator [Natronolimnobius baerhuensis]|uniref:Uncharacterized protein n=1 Tax=Natronolimnobius baerhuensis TaxID=253108 RepID=A0A202E6K3_9EURY|nr:hypothetical protein [Natronolimnobius baerhuensis]OVE83879.1 hypothetical protein B2G88_15830 [Natronolimnobius baerhuensis]
MGYEWGTQLFASSHRLALLRELRSNPADTKTLTDTLSISRVTVQRHLNHCTEHGWIRKVDGQYELTPVGERVCDATTTYLEELAVLEEHSAVIDCLASIDDSFDPLLLSDATVSVAEPNDPHEPIYHYRNAITGTTTDTIRGILPIFSELLIEVHRDLLDNGVETELIAPRPVLEAAPPPIEELPSPIFDVYMLEDTLEFGVTLTDERAFVGTYDAGTFVACIESTAPAFRDWADEIYERYRTQATRIQPAHSGNSE